MATAYDDLINQLYQEQLGRAPDVAGAEYWLNALSGGMSEAELRQAINQSLEGQNYDTQYITSLYRQILGRNPEQEGFQYWLSEAQARGYTPEQIRSILGEAALVEQGQRGITGQTFTDLQLPDLEADPYGGRYITNSIYDLLPEAVNVSTIGDRQAQFVSPVTQRPVISQYTTGGSAGFAANAGLDVLNTPAVQAAVQRAINSGSMTPEEYRTMYADLQSAQNMNDVYAAFNAPQAQVVIDALYGQQTGEANTLAQARAEAAQRQAVLDANNLGYYQANPQLAAQYEAAGLQYPFGADAYSGYDTRTDQSNVVTDENFGSQLNNVLRTLYGTFGGAQDMVTPLTGQYYSEAGLQPGYTPVGTPGTTFRSGVAGYTPNLPTMFQFGQAPVDASFQQYRPGAFQPAGVTTGGFITGYTAEGTPIYSTYANPNVNVTIPEDYNAALAAYNAAPLSESNFDANAYLAMYPDITANRWDQSPWQHYQLYGAREGRTAPVIPFNYTQPSQIINAPASAPANQFYIAPNGQVFASQAAYDATQVSAGG